MLDSHGEGLPDDELKRAIDVRFKELNVPYNGWGEEGTWKRQAAHALREGRIHVILFKVCACGQHNKLVIFSLPRDKVHGL